MKNKKITTILIFTLIILLVISSCTPNTKQSTDDMKANDEINQVLEGDMNGNNEFTGNAYNFSLYDLNGQVQKLSDFTGRKVYIKFWATWCSICLSGMFEFVEFDQANKDNEDLVILTIIAPGFSGEMNEEKFKSWFESQNLNFNVLLDEGGNVMREYGIRGFPTSVFIDRNGDISQTSVGHIYNMSIEEKLTQMQ